MRAVVQSSILASLMCLVPSLVAADPFDRPLPPTALLANQTEEGVELTWEPPVASPAPLTAYRVYRFDDTSRHIIVEVDANVTFYTDSTAPAGQAQTYYVTAVAGVEESAPSNFATVQYPNCWNIIDLNDPPFINSTCIWPPPPGINVELVVDELGDALEILER